MRPRGFAMNGGADQGWIPHHAVARDLPIRDFGIKGGLNHVVSAFLRGLAEAGWAAQRSADRLAA